MLIDVFMINDTFYETRCKENDQNNIFLSAKRNHTQKLWKEYSGQDLLYEWGLSDAH